MGEYGSVIFIAGNMPMKTEILPLLIMVKLDQYDYTGATAIGVLMLVVSFILLLLINLLQRRIETPEEAVVMSSATLTAAVRQRARRGKRLGSPRADRRRLAGVRPVPAAAAVHRSAPSSAPSSSPTPSPR